MIGRIIHLDKYKMSHHRGFYQENRKKIYNKHIKKNLYFSNSFRQNN